MTHNKLESKFSESYRREKMFWGMKLQNNMLAHTVTPADFLLNFVTTDIRGAPTLISNLVECKQVTCEDGENARLAFKRLKQMHDMLNFQHFSVFHRSYFLIGFLESRWDNSEVYLIPVENMRIFIEGHGFESANRRTMKDIFQKYKLKYEDQALDVWPLVRLVQ